MSTALRLAVGLLSVSFALVSVRATVLAWGYTGHVLVNGGATATVGYPAVHLERVLSGHVGPDRRALGSD